MSPPKPEAGTRVRLFFVTKTHLDGRMGIDLGGGSVTFAPEREAGIYRRIDWGQVYSFHRLGPRGEHLPVEPTLPLEMER